MMLAARCSDCPFPAVCPHCGTDFARLPRVIERGAWRIGDRWAEREHDGKVMLTTAEAEALRTIAGNAGRVSFEAITSRAGFGENWKSSAQNLVCRLRAKLPGLPIENVHGEGYVWASGEAR